MNQHNIWKHLSIATAMALVITACGGGGTPATTGTLTGLDPIADTTAPVFTSTNNATVAENQISAITLVATDTNTVSYSIADGESDSFSVDVNTGVVTFNTAPDYETKTSYAFTAKATDTAGNVVTQDVTITISDVDEVVIAEGQVPKKTGQTTTYVAKDDGDYQKGVSTSYTRDDVRKVVTDHITELEWQDNTEAKTITKNWADAKTYCTALGLDGGGWRLPTRAELVSLSNYGRVTPAIDPGFSNTVSNDYWSSTTYINAGYSGYAWYVNFRNGRQGYNYKSFSFYVRCVRAGQ